MSLKQIDLSDRDALDEVFLDCACYGRIAVGYATLKTGERVDVQGLTWNRVEKMRFNMDKMPFDVGVVSRSYPMLHKAVMSQAEMYNGSEREQYAFDFMKAFQELCEYTSEWFIPLEWMKEVYLEIKDINTKEKKT